MDSVLRWLYLLLGAGALVFLPVDQYENNIRQPRYDYLLKLTDFFNVEPEFFKAELHYKLEDIKSIMI